MAKFIKCPTCGTPIEVNPQELGQIVRCPGCGKGIKLVAKQKPGPSTGGSASSAGTYYAGPSASVSSSDTQRSFMGEPALDEPPRLDATCAVCGKLVDEADLVEERGQMMCKECAVADRAAHADSGMIEYAPPPYVPTKRGNIINLTPMFFVFCFFALAWGGSYIYLNIMPDPRRASVAHAAPAHKPTPAPTAPTTGPSEFGPRPTTAEAPAPSEPEGPTAAYIQWEKDNKDQILSKLSLAQQVLSAGEKDKAKRLYKEVFDTVQGHQDKIQDTALKVALITAGSLADSIDRPAEKPAEPATEPAANTTTAPAPQASDTNTSPSPTPPVPPAVPTNPLLAGLEKLKARDYESAAHFFEEARRKLFLTVPSTLTPDQALALGGKAAADLGRGRAEEARPSIDLLYQHGNQTRSTVLNRAMIYVASHAGLRDLVEATKSMRKYLDAHGEYDEAASNVFGTVLSRLSSMPLNPATRADLAIQQKFLDSYNEGGAAQHEGKLKWGIDWLPAEDVKRYRLLKGSVQDAALQQLYRQLDQAKVKATMAQKAYDQASSRAGTDVSSFKTRLDQANAAVEQVQQQVDAAKQAVQPQRWLEQFEPIIPEEGSTSPPG